MHTLSRLALSGTESVPDTPRFTLPDTPCYAPPNRPLSALRCTVSDTGVLVCCEPALGVQTPLAQAGYYQGIMMLAGGDKRV